MKYFALFEYVYHYLAKLRIYMYYSIFLVQRYESFMRISIIYALLIWQSNMGDNVKFIHLTVGDFNLGILGATPSGKFDGKSSFLMQTLFSGGQNHRKHQTHVFHNGFCN